MQPYRPNAAHLVLGWAISNSAAKRENRAASLDHGGGTIMTLSVTRNSNGTITIECGGDSLTILTIASSVASDTPHPKQEASGEIPVLWPNGGATASIVANGKAKTEVVLVPSVADLLSAIRQQHDLHLEGSKPTIFQFHVKGNEPLSVGKINDVLSDLEHFPLNMKHILRERGSWRIRLG